MFLLTLLSEPRGGYYSEFFGGPTFRFDLLAIMYAGLETKSWFYTVNTTDFCFLSFCFYFVESDNVKNIFINNNYINHWEMCI